MLPQSRGKHSSQSIDAILATVPAREYSAVPEADMLAEGPGIIMGLRVALLFNAFLGLASLLAYEAWTALAH